MMGEKGLPAGEEDDMVVKFNFVDNGEDQNQFQGDSVELEWTFTAVQEAGKDK
jgi:spore coat-associated protein N